MIRSFRFRDIFLLNRYRKHGHFLDSVPTLTWGRMIVPLGGLLSSFSTVTGVFTAISENDGQMPLLGQIVHGGGSPHAHFTFLAPRHAVRSAALPGLIDELVRRVGRRGAHSLIAEVEEGNAAFDALREAGFSVYARERVWRIARARRTPGANWRQATAADALAVQLLCGSLVPGMVQQVESQPWGRLQGYVNYVDGDLLAYADLRSGPRGQWLQPFVHQDSQNVGDVFAALVAKLKPRSRRPLYVCVRSYQSWLETPLRNMGAEPGPHQAVLVKRTTRAIKDLQSQRLPVSEGRRAEPTTPLQLPNLNVAHDTEIMSYDTTPNYR